MTSAFSGRSSKTPESRLSTGTSFSNLTPLPPKLGPGLSTAAKPGHSKHAAISDKAMIRILDKGHGLSGFIAGLAVRGLASPVGGAAGGPSWARAALLIFSISSEKNCSLEIGTIA